ncbi:MAG: response regulator, partial [Myxococcota bacterium]
LLEVLQRLTHLTDVTPIVVMSGHATISTAVEATRLGAFDFVEKPLETERVLVLDGDPAVRRGVTRALASLGYRVESMDPARLERSAVEALAALHPQVELVVLDRSGRAGEQLYEGVRAALPGAPIVDTGGDTADPGRLRKPFTPSELAWAARRALDARTPSGGGGDRA